MKDDEVLSARGKCVLRVYLDYDKDDMLIDTVMDAGLSEEEVEFIRESVEVTIRSYLNMMDGVIEA